MNTTAEILIIEDDIVAASLLKKALIDLGHVVVGTAASGKKAIEIARKKKPQLMMVDFELEDNMTGAEVTQEILREQSLARIFITSKSDSVTLKSIAETNPHGYILKPFDRKEIGMVVNTVIKKFRAEKKLSTQNLQLGLKVEMTTEELKKSLSELENEIELRKATEKELTLALNREKEFNNIKSRIAHNVSSEFKEPLTTILSSTEILKLKFEEDRNDIINKHLQRISEGSFQLKNVLSNIHYLENGSENTDTSPSIIDLKSFIEDIIDEVKKETEACPNIALHTYDIPNSIKAYAELLRKVIFNLISNAVKYSKNKEILINLVGKNNKVLFEFIDKGIGIPENEKDQIFEYFFRASNATGIPGSGLGLPMAKNFASLLGAELTFDSRESSGTKFNLLLPISII